MQFYKTIPSKFFYNSLLCLFLLLAINSCVQSQAKYQNEIKAVDKLFEKWNVEDSPGAAIGIIKDNKLIYGKGYGLANLEHNIPISTKTAFSIASNTKQFTAACIVLLHLEGKLNLNQTLHNFFPDFPDYAKKITIKHLLYHTSGLRDFSQMTYLSGLRPDDYYNDDDILNWIKNQKGLNFQPGEKYLYSNSGYWLLGQIVTKVSNMNLANFAQKELFIPLGMDATQFVNNNTLIVKNRGSGHGPKRSGGFRNILSNLEHIGNGGIFTNVEDLKKWDDEFYRRTVLDDDFWRLMTTTGILNNGETLDYAFGLFVKKYKGLKVIDHGGRAPGYWSNIIRFPAQNFSVIVLTNTTDAHASTLGYQIADILLKDKLHKSPNGQNASKVLKVETLSTQALKQFEASYWNEDGAYSRKIILKNDTLRYERTPRRRSKLVPIGNQKFKMLDTPFNLNIEIHFKKEHKGYQMIFVENGKKVGEFKPYTPVSYNVEELKPFFGRYYSEELKTYYEFKLRKKQLMLYINDRETIPLKPVMGHLFSSPMGIFEFKRNANRKVLSFTVSTPRVKNVVFER